jgi:hypothetical protein
MVGSTFGVAVMGALVATIGGSKIDAGLPHIPAATRTAIVNALGSGGTVGGSHVPAQAVAVAKDAFVSALSTGLTVSAVVTLCGAVAAWVLIAKRIKQPAPQTAPAGTPEEAPAEVSLV